MSNSETRQMQIVLDEEPYIEHVNDSGCAPTTLAQHVFIKRMLHQLGFEWPVSDDNPSNCGTFYLTLSIIEPDSTIDRIRNALVELKWAKQRHDTARILHWAGVVNALLGEFVGKMLKNQALEEVTR